MERIWFRITAEGWVNPVFPPGPTTTSRGCGGSPKCELMAAAMVMGLYWFETSFWMMSAGRAFWISWPLVGSNSDR
jgi:hypothetical protein